MEIHVKNIMKQNTQKAFNINRNSDSVFFCIHYVFTTYSRKFGTKVAMRKKCVWPHIPNYLSIQNVFVYIKISRAGCLRGVMVTMDCGIVVSEFVLPSRYYIHFRANTLGKGMNPLILPAMG